MKKTLLAVAMSFCIGLIAQAQTESLFDGNNSYGGFGGPIIEFSNINGELVGDVGGGGALVVNDFFIGGYGLGNNASILNFNNINYEIDFGHGGFWLGYAARQHKIIHLYTSLRLGWGEVELIEDDDKEFSDNLFAVSPEAGIEINFTDWFKLGLSGGYRYIDGIETLPVLTNDDFSGVFGAITFRFGGFGDYGSYSYNHNDLDDDDDDDFNF